MSASNHTFYSRVSELPADVRKHKLGARIYRSLLRVGHSAVLLDFESGGEELYFTPDAPVVVAMKLAALGVRPVLRL